jgi:deazaflavin-dependent oxidoreductase (nitroreductase family)
MGGVTDQPNLKYRIVSTAQKHIVNRVARHLPITMLETIGRKSGVPRRTPVGGRVIDNAFWMVSEHGNRAQYVKNIQANPSVRMRIRGRWRSGTAHLLPDDDPIERLKQLPGGNSAVVRLMGSDLLTVRVDLD